MENAHKRKITALALASSCGGAGVLPSRGEGWGLPVHEALAMALPTVVTGVAGPLDITGGNGTAWLLDPGGRGADGLARMLTLPAPPLAPMPLTELRLTRNRIGPLGFSLAGKGLEAGLWALDTIDIRAHAEGRHRSVDDTPAGGGPGMVMRADVLGDSGSDGGIGISKEVKRDQRYDGSDRWLRPLSSTPVQ